MALQQKQHDADMEKAAKLEDYIARNLVRASTTKMAQSRRKQLEKMEITEAPRTSHTDLKFRFTFDVTPYNEILTAKNISVTLGGKRLVEGLDLLVKRGERLVIAGPNGAGKSTLLRVLDGKLRAQAMRQCLLGGLWAFQSLPALAKDYVGADDKGRIADSDLRTRIIQNEMEGRAFQQTAVRAMLEAKGNSGPSAATSIIKYAAATFAQERSELMVEAMGAQGLGWEGEAYAPLELTAELIDQGVGPSNVHVLHESGRDIIVAANRESNEAALYFVSAS